MKNLIIVLIASLFALDAFATNNKPSEDKNTNTNSATGVGIGVGVGKADAQANVHNTNNIGVGVHNVNEVGVHNKVDNDNFNVNENLNTQGQLQGQLQGQKQEAVANSASTGNVNDNINYSSTGNVSGSNSQQQEANNEGVNTIVTGDTVRYEAADLSEAPGVPAAVYVDACSSAVSASAPGLGASFGQGNPVCLWVTLSNAALQQGDREKARLYLERAEDDLARQTAVTRWINWVPVVGRLF